MSGRSFSHYLSRQAVLQRVAVLRSKVLPAAHPCIHSLPLVEDHLLIVRDNPGMATETHVGSQIGVLTPGVHICRVCLLLLCRAIRFVAQGHNSTLKGL